jgi:hypothetical protein
MGSDTLGITTAYFGRGVHSTTPDATMSIHATDAITTSNTAGTALSFYVGLGTGNATPGNFAFYGSDVLGSGTTVQSAVQRAQIYGTSGDLAVNMRANGQAVNVQSVTETITLSSGTTADTVFTIPGNALVLFVSARVTTTITGAAAWGYGWSTDATANRYSAGALALALTSGTTNEGPDNAGTPQYCGGTARHVRIQSSGSAFTAGVVRLTAHYITTTVPTS